MNNYSGKQDKDKQSTDEAWAKLQSKLENESYNPQWTKWRKIRKPKLRILLT